MFQRHVLLCIVALCVAVGVAVADGDNVDTKGVWKITYSRDHDHPVVAPLYVAFDAGKGWFSDSEGGYLGIESTRDYDLSNTVLQAAGITEKTPIRMGIFNSREQQYVSCMSEPVTLTSNRHFTTTDGFSCK